MRYIKALVIYKRYYLYKMQFHSDSTVRSVQKIKYTVLWHKECIHWKTHGIILEKESVFSHSSLKMSIFFSTSANNMLILRKITHFENIRGKCRFFFEKSWDNFGRKFCIFPQIFPIFSQNGQNLHILAKNVDPISASVPKGLGLIW